MVLSDCTAAPNCGPKRLVMDAPPQLTSPLALLRWPASQRSTLRGCWTGPAGTWGAHAAPPAPPRCALAEWARLSRTLPPSGQAISDVDTASSQQRQEGLWLIA